MTRLLRALTDENTTKILTASGYFVNIFRFHIAKKILFKSKASLISSGWHIPSYCNTARHSGRMIFDDVANVDRCLQNDRSQAVSHVFDPRQRDCIKRAHARHRKCAAFDKHVCRNRPQRILDFLSRPCIPARAEISCHRKHFVSSPSLTPT